MLSSKNSPGSRCESAAWQTDSNQGRFEMKKLVLGITVLLVIALTIGIGVVKFGLVPVNADVPPSSLEMRFIPIAVRASVAHHAEDTQPSRSD